MTDTNYNDGKWHGWQGGECPVHPKSEVDLLDEIQGKVYGMPAEAVHWSFSGAFRVTKEHKEPREWWIVPGCGFYNNEKRANAAASQVVTNPIHVREVIGDDT